MNDESTPSDVITRIKVILPSKLTNPLHNSEEQLLVNFSVTYSLNIYIFIGII